jgi:hypothetical protein
MESNTTFSIIFAFIAPPEVVEGEAAVEVEDKVEAAAEAEDEAEAKAAAAEANFEGGFPQSSSQPSNCRRSSFVRTSHRTSPLTTVR